MKIIDCKNPTKWGIIIRLKIALLLIIYGVMEVNYVVLAIGFVPIVRLSMYFYQKSRKT